MTADDPLGWINPKVQAGTILSVEGWALQSKPAADLWAAKAQRWYQEAIDGVKDRSPKDAWRIETLSPIQSLDLPLGHPYWTPMPALFKVHCTTSVECEDNNPLSCHDKAVERLEEIARDWEAKLPKGQVGRRGIDDSKKIAEATRLMRTEGLSANKAAGRIFPDNPSSQRRLYGKLPSKQVLKQGP